MQGMQPSQGQGQGGEQGGNIIETTGQVLTGIVESLAQIPQIGPELAKRMQAVVQEYTDIVSTASQAVQGGGAGGPSQRPQQPSRAMPDRSQGSPSNPAGVY